MFFGVIGSRMIIRFFRPPSQSYFIFGPRGTGKSTWLKEHYKDAFWIDLLDPELFRLYSSTPKAQANFRGTSRS